MLHAQLLLSDLGKLAKALDDIRGLDGLVRVDGLLFGRHTRQDHQGCNVAVGTECDIRVQAVSNHACPCWVRVVVGEEAVQHGLVRFTHNHRLSLQSRNQRLAQRASSWEDTIRCWESRIIIRKNEVGVLFLVVEVSECLCEFAVVDVDIESTDDCADRWVLLDRAEISVSHNNARILAGAAGLDANLLELIDDSRLANDKDTLVLGEVEDIAEVDGCGKRRAEDVFLRGMDTQLFKLFHIVLAGQCAVVGHEHQLLSIFTKELDSVEDSVKNMASVPENTITVEEEGVVFVEEGLVLVDSGEFLRDSCSRWHGDV